MTVSRNLRAFLIACSGILLPALLFAGCSGGRSWFGPKILLDEFKLQPVKQEIAEPTHLTRFTTDEFYGRISPDGLSLVYVSNQKGSPDIWLKDLTTGIPERLTDHVAVDTMPSFSPDGKSILFVSMRSDVTGDVYLQKIGDDEPEPLTDRKTADSYPVFAPDGESFFMSSGPEGKQQVVRYWLKQKRFEKLGGVGSTHPAVSPDGQYLAFVEPNEEKVNELVLLHLSSRKKKTVTAEGYQCGFPSFSPDGKRLFFVRFYYTQPGSLLDGNENGTVWSVPTNLAWKLPPSKVRDKMVQVTSGRMNHLFLQAHANGLVYTTKQDNNLDVWMQPFTGLFPEFKSPDQALAFALSLEDDFDRLIALRKLSRFKNAPEYQESLYRASLIERRNQWYFKQKDSLDELNALSTPYGDFQGLAKVDLAVWDTESTQGLQVKTGVRLQPEQISRALDQLKTVGTEYGHNPHVSAYVQLRQGDMLRIQGQDIQAISAYETVLNEYPDQREEGVQAKIRLGEIFSSIRARDLQVRYYLTLFKQYPEFEDWLRLTIENIVQEYRRELRQIPEIHALLNPPEFDADRRRIPEKIRQEQIARGVAKVDERLVDQLRALIDVNPDNPLLGSVLQFKIGKIYESQKRLDLAARAMQQIVNAYPERKREVTQATFQLGDYALKISEDLRDKGRFNEAAGYYSEALSYYENITKMYPPKHRHHRKARKEFLSLALLKAGLEERQDDWVSAMKSYQKVADFDPGVIQAQRKIIFYGVRNGKYDKLEEAFEEMIDKDSTDFVGHYCLGYLLTWKPDLDEGDLDDAEEELLIAMALNSQSPYSYLTLGWIYEMREAVFGDISSGWIEESIDAYDRAYRTNDRRADLQTEADILINLGNVFAQLGNTWRYAYDKYKERVGLKLPFLDKKREALFYVRYGRAAFNLDEYEEASVYFERSLELARKFKLRELEAELIARLALNYQMQGRYDTSTEYFQRAMEIFISVKKMNVLAALTRSISLNFYRKGDRKTAVEKLDLSLKYLKKYGVRPPGDFIPIAIGRNSSLSPMGFTKGWEKNVNLSLRNLILEDLEQYRSGQARLEEKYAYLDKLLAEKDGIHGDLQRELSVLDNRMGRFAFHAGMDDAALEHFGKSYMQFEVIQSKELEEDDPDLKTIETMKDRNDLFAENSKEKMKFVLDPKEFEEQMLHALAASDVLLRQLSEDRMLTENRLREVLIRLERGLRRMEKVQGDGDPIIQEDLIWKLYNNIAILSLKYGERTLAKSSQASSTADIAAMTLLREAELFTQGVGYLKKVSQLTAPPEKEEEEPPAVDMAVSPWLRARMHAQSLLNLSELAGYFETKEELADADGRSMKYLLKAKAFCENPPKDAETEEGTWKPRRMELEEICWNVRMTYAARTGNAAQADEIIADFLANSPKMLGETYLQHAEAVRNRLFSQAMEMAAAAGDYARLWKLAEQQSRRLVLDEMEKVGYGVDSPDLKILLKNIDEYARAYRKEVEGQSFWETPAKHNERLARMDGLRKTLLEGMQQLKEKAPKLSDLFSIGNPDPSAALPVLREGEAIASYLTVGDRIYLLILDPQGVRGTVLPQKLDGIRKAALRFEPDADATRTEETADLPVLLSLVKPLMKELKDKKLVYLDIDRLSPRFPIYSFARRLNRPDLSIVKIASVAGLADSFANRNLSKQTGMAVIYEEKQAKSILPDVMKRLIQEHGSWKVAAEKNALAAAVLPDLKKSGFAILDQPLVFEGTSAANAWLKFQSDLEGIGQYQLVKHLDSLWNTNLAIFANVQHTQRVREERLFLERILNAAGIPGFVLVDRATTPIGTAIQWFETAAPLLKKKSRAEAYQAGLKAVLLPDKTPGGDGVQLYGYAGMNEEQTMAYAKASLMPTIKKAIGLQKAKAPRAAVEEYEKALGFIDYTGETKFLGKVLEFLVDQSKVIRDWDRAIKYQHRILAPIEEAAKTDKKQLAPLVTAKKTLADLYTMGKYYDDALKYNQEIIDLMLSFKARKRLGPFYSQRGLILERAARYPDALKNFEEAFDIFTAIENTDGRLEQARNAARILRQRLSDYKGAMKYNQLAQELSETASDYSRYLLKLQEARILQAQGDHPKTVSICLDLIEKGKEGSAKALAEGMKIAKDKSIDKAKKKELLLPLMKARDQMDDIQLLSYLDAIKSLSLSGRFGQAMERIGNAKVFAEKKKDTGKLIQLLNARGYIYAKLGNTDEAIKAYEEAIALTVEIGNLGEEAIGHNNVGDALRLAGRFADARQAFMHAMELDRKLGDSVGLAFDYANIGLAFEGMGRDVDAIENLSEAIALSRKLGNPLNELKSLIALGRIYIKQQKLDSARKNLEDGLALAVKLNDTNWEWKYRLQLGRVDVLEGRTKEGLEHFLTAIETTESMPPIIRVAKNGPRIEEETSELYDEALDILSKEGKSEEAFDLTERYRSRQFLDLFGGETIAFPFKGVLERLAKEKESRTRLQAARNEWLKAPEDGKAAAKTALDEARASYDASLADLANLNERLPAYVKVDSRPFAELLPLLPDDYALISYYQTGNALLIWTVAGGSLSMERVEITRDSSNERVKTFRNLLLNFHPVETVAQSLYEQLILPVQDRIRDREKWVVVPFGPLHFVPFAALYDGKRFLLDMKAVSYLSSMNQLRFLGSAGGKMPKNPKRLALGGEITEGNDLGKLPFTKHELESFGYTFVNPTVLIGENASEEEFKRLAPGVDHIHIASHADLDRVSPIRSSLTLAPKGNEDGKLRLSEVLALPLKAELVTLSACETALGPLGSGDEVIGLSRAFLGAGARRVLASLWRVSDLATAVLMKHMFRRLKEEAPSPALRDAQKEVRTFFPHPNYWAGFRLEGALN